VAEALAKMPAERKRTPPKKRVQAQNKPRISELMPEQNQDQPISPSQQYLERSGMGSIKHGKRDSATGESNAQESKHSQGS